MDILEDSITCLASEGRMTLQVPELFIGSAPKFITVPDDWFHYLDVGAKPVAGNESGFLYLTTIGYAANKDDIKAAYLKAVQAGGYRGKLTWDEAAQDWDRPWVEGEDYFADDELDDVWAEFEAHVQEHFAKLRKNLAKAVMKTQHKLAEAQAFGTKKSVAYWQRKLTDLQNYVV